MRLADLDSRDALDRYDQERVDPWGIRTNKEKRVRYLELRRLLPRGPFENAVDLACGEGEFSIEMTEEAFTIVGIDLSEVVVDRARGYFSQVNFQQADVKSLSEQWFKSFDLVVWLDAIYLLSKEESAELLRRIASSHDRRPIALLLSSRITPPGRTDMDYWSGRDFESPREFLEHVRRFFPTARGIPVQLNLNLRPTNRLTAAQRLAALTLKALDGLGAYRVALRLVQWVMQAPRLANCVEPFVVQLAAVVDPHRQRSAERKEEIVSLSELSSREALDRWYQKRDDPWATRTNREKRVRYEELDRFLPQGPFQRALDIACGEGDFSHRLFRVAQDVSATDLSGVVLERARDRFPEIRFFQSDVRALQAEGFRGFDLIVWLDAIIWLTREESVRVLREIAESRKNRRAALLLSVRVTPSDRADLSYWESHDFESPGQFLEHIRQVFPEARGVPVQLHLDLTAPQRLTLSQRAVQFSLKVLNHWGGYRLALHLVQRASTVPFLAPFVDPFIVHIAAIVDPPNTPYPKSVEDVTDRFLNRPLAGRIVQWLMPTSITPNQVTLISCLAGVAAAATLSLGSWPALIVGALLLQLSIVVDCADGQLARAKGLTSQWGEVFDHTSDDLSFLLVSVVLGLTVWQSDLNLTGKLLLVIASFSAALLLTASQYFYNEEYRNAAARGVGGGVRDDREKIVKACESQGKNWRGRLGRGLLRYYAFRLGLMHRGLTWLNPWRDRLLTVGPVGTSARRAYWELQAFPLWLWRLAGMSSVALLLVLACLIGTPLAIGWLLTFVGLPYGVWVLWLQRRADEKTFKAWTE